MGAAMPLRGWWRLDSGTLLSWALAALAAVCVHLVALVLLVVSEAPVEELRLSYLQVDLVALPPLAQSGAEVVDVDVDVSPDAGDSAAKVASRETGADASSAGGASLALQRGERAEVALPSRQQGAASEVESLREEPLVLPPEPSEKEVATASNADLVERVGGRISKKLKRAWKVPYSAQPGTRARVRIQLDRRGNIGRVDFAESSGSASFDASVVRTLRGIGQFPSLLVLPEDLYSNQFRELVLVFDAESGRRL